jgi:hypothetical protein
MRSRITLAAVAALGAAGIATVSAAAPDPYLRSVAVKRSHVVAVFTLGELAPAHISVAARPGTSSNGAFLRANVRLEEQLRARKTNGGYRAQTKRTLSPGRYWVKVSGTVIGLDCTPHKPCKTTWSNARRVVVPRPR